MDKEAPKQPGRSNVIDITSKSGNNDKRLPVEDGKKNRAESEASAYSIPEDVISGIIDCYKEKYRQKKLRDLFESIQKTIQNERLTWNGSAEDLEGRERLRNILEEQKDKAGNRTKQKAISILINNLGLNSEEFTDEKSLETASEKLAEELEKTLKWIGSSENAELLDGKRSEGDIFDELKFEGGEFLYNDGVEEEFLKKIDEANEKIITAIKEKISKNSESKEPKELQELEVGLEEARRSYAESNFKTTNIISSLKRVLGMNLKTGEDSVSGNQEKYQEYRESLNAILDKKIEDLKKSGLSGDELKKEMGNLATYFNVNERVRLHEAYTEARTMEIARKGGVKLGFVSETANKYINWRKKNKWYVNISLGLAMSAAGLGIVNRASGALVSGVGASHMAEGAYRKGVQIKQRRDLKKTLKDANFDEKSEESFQKLREHLQGRIDRSDKLLKNEKIASYVSLGVGAGVGFLVGSGVASDILKSGLGYLKDTDAYQWVHGKASDLLEYVKDTDAYKTVHDRVAEFLGTDDGVPKQEFIPSDSPVPDGLPKQEFIPSDSPVPDGDPNLAKFPSTGLEIVKGSSTQGSIIKYLESQGLPKEEAGKVAHRMYLEFGKDLSSVHPGDEVRVSFNPDNIDSPTKGYSISGFEPKSGIRPSWMDGAGSSHEIPDAEHHGSPYEADVAEADGWVKANQANLEELQSIKAEAARLESQVNIKLSREELMERLAKVDSQIEAQERFNNEWDVNEARVPDDLIKMKQGIEFELDKFRKIDDIKNEYLIKYSKVNANLLRTMFSGSGIERIDDLGNFNAKEFLAQNPKSGAAKMMRGLSGIWSDGSASPKPGENLKVWSGRILKLIVNKK